MAILPPVSSPRTALRDFVSVFRHGENRDRILGLTLAVLITIIIVIIFFVDSTVNTAPPQQITYVQNISRRTDATSSPIRKRIRQARRYAKAKQSSQKLDKSSHE